MKCPDCRSALQVVSCKGVPIHECLSCKGKWFERDELTRLKNRADAGLRWIDFDPFDDKAAHFTTASEGKGCPQCHKPMESLRYRSSAIVIDKCSVCRGVWLDAGELHKIISYLEKMIRSRDAGSLSRDTINQFLKAMAGPGESGEELKDFLAVLYLLEVRVGVEHPGLTAMTQKIFQYAPFL